MEKTREDRPNFSPGIDLLLVRKAMKTNPNISDLQIIQVVTAML